MPFSRRKFIHTVAATAATGVFTRYLGNAGEPVAKPISETLVGELFKSLSPEQKAAVCFGFDDPLRLKVDNNWHITKQTISAFFKPDQQDLIKQIFMGLHSAEYAQKVLQQVEHDNGKGGFGSCSIALFGEPGTGKFEFVLAGRHVTRRCDGDSVEGAAFGGPIFYGHAARSFNESAKHEDNIYWYQALRANEVYQMLDGKQREKALLGTGRDENETATVKLSGKKEGLAGIGVADLTKDQQAHVRMVLADVLAPFRDVDVKEALKLVEKNGFENLHLSFYKNQDIGNDGVWDVWQIEGPAMIWYFRGQPHVHTWVHIRENAI